MRVLGDGIGRPSNPTAPPATSCLTATFSGDVFLMMMMINYGVDSPGACWRLCGPQCVEKQGNCPGTWSRC